MSGTIQLTTDAYIFYRKAVEESFIRKRCPLRAIDKATLAYEAPDFITLDTLARESAHRFVHQLCAAFASENEQAENRVAMHLSDSFDASYAYAFNEHL